MKKFEVTLATVEAVPACIATVEVMADNLKQAQHLALQMEYLDLNWFDERGQSVDWSEVIGGFVVPAE